MKQDFLNLGVSGVGRKRNDKRSISGIIGVCGRCSIDKRGANNAIKRQQTSGSRGVSNIPQKGHYHVHGKEAFVLTLSEITASLNIDRYAKNLKELVKQGLHKRNRHFVP
jgi:hypothetical protein